MVCLHWFLVWCRLVPDHGFSQLILFLTLTKAYLCLFLVLTSANSWLQLCLLILWCDLGLPPNQNSVFYPSCYLSSYPATTTRPDQSAVCSSVLSSCRLVLLFPRTILSVCTSISQPNLTPERSFHGPDYWRLCHRAFSLTVLLCRGAWAKGVRDALSSSWPPTLVWDCLLEKVNFLELGHCNRYLLAMIRICEC